MKTSQRNMLGIVAVVLVSLGCVNHVQAEFYLRPVVQYSELTGSLADASGALGGGLSLGAAFGRERRFDVGAEVLFTRYNGTFREPMAYGAPIPQPRVPASYNVMNVLAAFRYSFSGQAAVVRPFVGMVLGISTVNIVKKGTEDSGISFTGGLGGGGSFKLGQRTRLDIGYRYVFSSETSALFTNSDFHYNAHVLSLALDQRF